MLRLCDLVVEIARDHIDVINKQIRNISGLVNDQTIFREIKISITNEDLNPLLHE